MDASISIDKLELMALKKLALINNALAESLKNHGAKTEQKALLSVLVNIISRGDLAFAKAGVGE